MPNDRIDMKLLKLSLDALSRHPEISQENRDLITHQIIGLNMSPFEAKLAGGSFFFKVKADTECWPRDSNPLAVIEAQHDKPDNSEFWLTFKNSSQYPENGPTRFEVYFERGRAKNISVT